MNGPAALGLPVPRMRKLFPGQIVGPAQPLLPFGDFLPEGRWVGKDGLPHPGGGWALAQGGTWRGVEGRGLPRGDLGPNPSRGGEAGSNNLAGETSLKRGGGPR